MRVCDICEEKLNYKNEVKIETSYHSVGEYNGVVEVRNTTEICKKCKEKIKDFIETIEVKKWCNHYGL